MSTLACAIGISIAMGLLALVAWASAWKTLEWLGNAEDLIELAAHAFKFPYVTSPDERDRVALELQGYRRRSPQRRPL